MCICVREKKVKKRKVVEIMIILMGKGNTGAGYMYIYLCESVLKQIIVCMEEERETREGILTMKREFEHDTDK